MEEEAKFVHFFDDVERLTTHSFAGAARRRWRWRWGL
jgi:hypothetical protein